MINYIEMIPIKWTTRNKAYYEGKGYEFTKMGEEFCVTIQDLPEDSNIRVPVMCDCDDCKNQNVMTPYRNYNRIVRDNGQYLCKACTFKKSMDIRDKKSKQRLFDIFINKCREHGCTPITTYDTFNGSKSFVKYICPIHGETETFMNNIVSSDAWCYKCGKLQMASKCSLSYEEVKSKVETKNNNILLNAGDYVNFTTKNLRVICGSCGDEFMTSLSSIYNSDGRCSRCGQRVYGDSIRTTVEELIDMVTIDDTVMVVDPENYIDMYTELYFYCEECGEKFLTRPYNYAKRCFRRCKNCQHYSIGEDIIAATLDELGISYDRQKRFQDCKDIKTLPFDFYVPQLNYLIEYNGMQHYTAVDYFGGQEAYEKTRRHDQIKASYAIDNNINLLVIPYTEQDNIKNIVSKIVIQ